MAEGRGLVIGHVNEQGRHVFSDGTPVLPLTPERRLELLEHWFGRLPEKGQQPVRRGQSVQVQCSGCGVTFTLAAKDYTERRRKSSAGNMYCTRACGHEAKRQQRLERRGA